MWWYSSVSHRRLKMENEILCEPGLCCEILYKNRRKSNKTLKQRYITKTIKETQEERKRLIVLEK